MEDKSQSILSRSYGMNGGDGPNSYAQNSVLQRGITEAAKVIISEEIANKLDIQELSLASSKLLRIADLGCSYASNTILAIQNIIEAIECKFQSHGLISPEFHVFFNDLVTNDFNSLFASLPVGRKYYAAGVPGSFYDRLFPKASLHFVYSSSALHWLSKDMDSFLKARVKELVPGGLMALVIPASPDVASHPQEVGSSELELLGSCLVDMAKMGIVSEVKVDAFNVPAYFTSPKELRQIVEGNGCFSIERMDILNNPNKHQVLPDLRQRVLFIRVLWSSQ
ncbi:hypothetical protein PTKIN_Ptkin16aG0015400 [Pterospermum kingtungense]